MIRTLFVVLFALSGFHCSTVKESAPAQPAAAREMSVQEFARLRAAGDAPFLLDVRNPEEVAIATMGANQLIPLGELPARIEELAAYRNLPIVVHCRTGRRSTEATKVLVGAGFTQVINLTGGILAWSKEIDPSVPTY